MTKVKYNNLRAQVQKVEEKILAITGKNVEFNMEWTRSQRKCEQVERLIWKRKHLLDKMFVATPEEVVRMEQVNRSVVSSSYPIVILTLSPALKTMLRCCSRVPSVLSCCKYGLSGRVISAVSTMSVTDFLTDTAEGLMARMTGSLLLTEAIEREHFIENIVR